MGNGYSVVCLLHTLQVVIPDWTFKQLLTKAKQQPDI